MLLLRIPKTPLLTLTELKYIVAVARESTLAAQPKLCYMSQPTLSVAIKKLEERAGCQDFRAQCR